MSEPTEMPYELQSLLRADGDGPAARLDAAAAQRLVAQALDAAEQPRVAPLRIKRYAWLLAAALVITGSAAAMYAAQRAGDADAEAAARRSAAAPEPSAAQVEPASPPAANAATQQAAAPSAAAGAQAPSAEPARPAAVAIEPRAHEPVAAAGGASGAQDLLRRANRLRGEGRYRAAERTYLRVVAQSPGGAPAYSARVAAASLRIERLNDARGALQLYNDALRTRPHGALAPEIHEGMAMAFRKLGQPARERESLAALLREQPDGPAAERARTRLAQLER